MIIYYCKLQFTPKGLYKMIHCTINGNDNDFTTLIPICSDLTRSMTAIIL